VIGRIDRSIGVIKGETKYSMVEIEQSGGNLENGLNINTGKTISYFIQEVPQCSYRDKYSRITH
jgi:hypothetical protein